MRRSIILAPVCALLAGSPALGSNGANPDATYCYNGGTIGSAVGGGSGGGSGSNTCTYANASASFGASYLTNQESTAAPTACAAGAPQIPAEHLFADSFGTSVLVPLLTDDDKFLAKTGDTPAAIIEIETSDALNDFSTMPDVPPLIPAGLPGAGHFMGCPSTVMEAKLHRSWPAFGNSYYYGDPTAPTVSDPTNFKYFACWQPITLGYSAVYQYRQWATPGTPETMCTNAGYTGFDYAQCVWCLRHPDDGVPVPDPATWNGTSTTGTTVGSGSGYYITSNARDTTNKSLFWSGAVIDYPPMWLSLYWTGKFMANNAMTDLTGKYLFPLRREVRTINNTMTGACTPSSGAGGNGMHPDCSRTNPYTGDSSFNSIFNFLDNQFKPFLQGTSVGTDMPLAGAIVDAANAYVTGGYQPSGNNAGWCTTCARNHIVVLSAGDTCHDPGTGVDSASYYDPSVTCTGACAYTAPMCSLKGSNYTCDGSTPVWPPQVASKLGNTDLLPGTPGQQSITVDTIALGPNQQALKSAAKVSGGIFVDASQDPSQIHDALFSILNGMVSASVTTASTPVNSVQTSAGSQDELIPQFIPLAGESIYEGHLYKYYFFSEFAAGCTSAGQSVNFPDPTSSASTINCPCLGGQCNGRYSVDLNNKFVLRANDGTLRALDYATLTGFYTANGRVPTALELLAYPLATPVWDTAAVMGDSVNHPWYQRRTYTAIDTNGDGKVDTNDGVNGLYAITTTSSGVTAAVANALTPYLGIVGTTLGKSNICTQIAAIPGIGVTYPDVSPNPPYQSCAMAILNYALGKDVFDSNGNGSTTDNRSNMLGDIYHATPLDIGPPTQESFCDFNPRRCVATLFNVNNPTDSTNYNALDFPASYYKDDGTTGSGGATVDAYEAYANNRLYGTRDSQVRVFGANDGWIHAIQFSCYKGISNGQPLYYGGPGHSGCTSVTTDNGNELWAFIPPDLLAKLPLLLLKRHQIFNDLTPMVRDLYAGPGVKKMVADFHTVAIFGERNGGTRWTALDVTSPTAPALRWIFPQVGSVDELRAGLSWGEYFPGSPPIGPVRMDTTLGGSPTYNGQSFHETWVVMLPGGYDRYGAKGRGFWMLDAWTGQKVWEAWGPSVTGMAFSFAAYPAMAAWGTSAASSGGILNNGFFDTAVIADTGGTVWTARFNDVPTRALNAYGDTVATNWGVGRTFRQFDGDDTGSGPVYKMANRAPFFTMPALGRMPDSGFLRAYLGAGDRANVSDQYLGDCGGGNMLACGKQGVLTMAERDQDIGASSLHGASQSFDGSLAANLTVGGLLTYNTGSASQCTPADNLLDVCLSASGTGSWAASASAPNQPQVSCVNTTSGEACSRILPTGLTVTTQFNPSNGQLGSISSVYSSSGNGYYSRFYGITVFKALPAGRNPFNASGAAAYDATRTTEVTSACPASGSGLCNLYPSGVMNDYSYPETTSKFNTPGVSNGSSDGFYFYYPNIDEKTAGNALLAGGCLLWSTIQPTSPCNSDADCASFSAGVAGGGTVISGQCNTTAHECQPSSQCNVVGGSSAGHIYQMNALQGTTDCPLTSTTSPRMSFGTILPPPPPQRVVLINPAGLVQQSVFVGAGFAGNVLPPRTGSNQLFRTYFDLELPRPVHDCRHNGNCPPQ